MLVLTVRTDEEILIGDDIRVMLVRIGQNGKVRLGITAPGLEVDRAEVRAAKLRALTASGEDGTMGA